MTSRGPRGDTGLRGDQGERGEGARGQTGLQGEQGERGKPGRSTYNGPLDFVFRNALPLVAILGVLFGYVALDRSQDASDHGDCEARQLTRANQRTQIGYDIQTGIVFRDTSKSPAVRSYFERTIPERKELLRDTPPIKC